MTRAAAFLIAAVALLPSAGARAASLRELSVEEMADRATDIVIGDVESSEARWQGKLIVTVSSIRVGEALKGGGGGRLEITQLGGTAVHPVIGKPVSMTVSSQVVFRPGERVLLFVEESRPGLRQVVGAEQGKFVIRDDPSSGRAAIPVGPRQLTVQREGDRQTLGAEPTELDAMRRRIQTHLGRGAR